MPGLGRRVSSAGPAEKGARNEKGPTAGAPGWFAGVLLDANVCGSRLGLKLGIARTRWVTALRRSAPVRRSEAKWNDDDPRTRSSALGRAVVENAETGWSTKAIVVGVQGLEE